MHADRHRARRLLRDIQAARESGRPHDDRLGRLRGLLDRSIERRRRRQAAAPRIRYDESLPIHAARTEIARAIQQHQVVVVCGETGSGKSTQLPKICLEMGRGIAGVIGHTQPRRVAARSIAARIAEELGSSLGTHVGFKIRFTDVTGEGTYVKLMTDGVLLAETQQDRFLEAYDTIIVDEAHERSLNIDFLLGYLHRLLPTRPDLRVIITSATIDAERFAAHFAGEQGPAPIIEVSGRTYPVEVRYRPLEPDDEDEIDVARGIADAADELMREGPGDLLVFLPTERDIRDAAKVLRGRLRSSGRNGADILPLYARLTAAEQNKVFQAHSGRRIVLATNVAESSLTVPGIRYVIDTGTARVSRYAPRSKIQRLPVEPVSRASADQRMGRCGRVGPGICVRLYSEEDYLNRDRYTTPEIRRTNLASVILRTIAMRLGRIDDFPFLDPPRPEAVRDGHRTLREIGAIDAHWKLTDIGRKLAALPVDPRIGRMILAADEEGCLHETLIIAAGLEVQDPRERPAGRQQDADEAHARFANPDSDFLTYLTMWDFHHELKSKLSRGQLQKACRRNFLSNNRMREWQEVHRQLVRLCGQTGMKPGARRDDSDAIHRSLLAGLLSNIAMSGERHEYRGAGGVEFHLWPGSVLFAKKPTWIVAAELVETSRRYLRTVGRVNPSWIEPLAQHLVKRSHADPYWSRKRSTVMVHEKVTLLGLTIVAKRPVPFGPIDPRQSREIFMRDALVAGEFDSRVEFYVANRKLIEQLRNLGAKARRRDYLVDDWTCFDFYDRRLPDHVFDARSLKVWLDGLNSRDKAALLMTPQDLIPGQDVEETGESFPERLSVGDVACRFQYRFEPGAADDGVTLTVPREAVGSLNAEQLGWLVPGLLETKIAALIRSLPKSVRRALVPVPDTAKKAMSMLDFGQGPFLPALVKVLSQLAGEPISADQFDTARVEPHLRMNVRVVDESGESIAEGRDVVEIRGQLGIADGTASSTIDDARWNRDGITRWDLGDLPPKVDLPRGQFTVAGYPTLIDQGESVSLRLLDNRELSERRTRAGLRRLFLLKEHKEIASQVRWFPDLNQLQMYAATLRHSSRLPDQLAELIADLAFVRGAAIPRTEPEFLEAAKRGRRRIGEAVQDVTRVVAPTLRTYHRVRLALEELEATAWRDAVEDAREQIAQLMPDGFLVDTPWQWLEHFPRYLEAVAVRLEKIADARGARDRESMEVARPHQDRYRERRAKHQAEGIVDPELETYRWMIEELRVSLFAQTLGTSIKISPQRLEKQWDKVRL